MSSEFQVTSQRGAQDAVVRYDSLGAGEESFKTASQGEVKAGMEVEDKENGNMEKNTVKNC